MTKGLAILYFAVVIFLQFATTTWSQTAYDKQCVFAAAEKLPKIQGLTITSSHTQLGIIDSKAAETIVKTTMTSLGGPLAATTWLNRNLGYVMPEWKIKDAIATGQRMHVPEMLSKELSKRIYGSLTVEIQVRAAAQDAKYTFVCSWGELGRPVVAPLGISR